jgi:hypothetical protein
LKTRKIRLYKKKPVKNIKNKFKPKRRYQAKIINKNESIEKSMMNSPEEPYIGNSKQMLQQKNVTARSIIDAGLKSLQTKLRHLQ